MNPNGGGRRSSHVSCVRKEGPRYARAAGAPESSDVLRALPEARAARPRAGGRGDPRGRPRGPAPRPADLRPRRLLAGARDVRPAGGGLLGELPRQRAGGDRPRQGDEGEAARGVRVRRRAQRVVRGRRVPRARGGRDRLHRAWRGRGHRPARAGGHRRSEARHPARRGDPDRRGPEPDPARQPRPPPARARPGPQAPQVLHRRPRPLRLGGVHSRVPVGLLVLQRVDLLRAQLPQGHPGGGGRGPGPHPRAQRVHRGRRGLHPRRARRRDRERDRAAAYPQAVLPSRPAATC